VCRVLPCAGFRCGVGGVRGAQWNPTRSSIVIDIELICSSLTFYSILFYLFRYTVHRGCGGRF
jgi:hypothetical protein